MLFAPCFFALSWASSIVRPRAIPKPTLLQEDASRMTNKTELVTRRIPLNNMENQAVCIAACSSKRDAEADASGGRRANDKHSGHEKNSYVEKGRAHPRSFVYARCRSRLFHRKKRQDYTRKAVMISVS